jgi:hypothetical protein
MNTAREATVHLLQLLRREQAAMADFLVALAAFDERRGWLELGYSGLFPFLQRELGLSKSGAYYRKTACELVRRYPELADHFRAGRLCLSVVAELARVVTDDNVEAVLPRFLGTSKQEAKEVAAAVDPVKAPPSRLVVSAIRPASGPSGAGTDRVLPEEPTHRQVAEADGAALARASVATHGAGGAPSRERAQAEPLTAELRRLHVTVSRKFLDKLEAATAALSHSHRGAGAEEILEAGLDLLLDRAARRRGLVVRPQQQPRPASPDHVPARVKREVWTRDGGRCQWKLDSGAICGSTHRLELDHVVPRALGGASTADNLTVLCSVHNAVAARQVFGERHMDRFTASGRGAEAVRELRSSAP